MAAFFTELVSFYQGFAKEFGFTGAGLATGASIWLSYQQLRAARQMTNARNQRKSFPENSAEKPAARIYQPTTEELIRYARPGGSSSSPVRASRRASSPIGYGGGSGSNPLFGLLLLFLGMAAVLLLIPVWVPLLITAAPIYAFSRIRTPKWRLASLSVSWVLTGVWVAFAVILFRGN